MAEPGGPPAPGPGDGQSPSRQGVGTIWGAVLPALLLSLQLAAYGLVGTLPVLTFWLPWRESANVARFRVDTMRNETVFLDESYATTIPFVVGYMAYASMPMFSFVPSVLGACLRLPWQQFAALLAVTPVAAAAFTLIGRNGTSSPLLTGPLLVSPYPFQWAILRFRLCPPGSKVPATMALMLTVLFFSFIVVINLQALSVLHRDLAVYVVIPFGKEAVNFVFRTVARRIILDANAGGDGVIMRRSPAWGLVVASNLGFAMYTRLLYTTEKSPMLRGLMVAYQCFTEVLLRLTVRWRDTKLRAWRRKLAQRLFGGSGATARRSTAIVAPAALAQAGDNKASEQAQRTAQNPSEAADSLNHYFANIVIIEALSEYVAIYMVGLYMFMFRGDVLALPLEYYLAQDNLFDEPIDTTPLLLWMLTQALAELAVDTICGTAEMYKDGLHLRAAWRERAPDFGVWFAFASWFVQVNMSGILQPDNLAACLGDDMCRCANNNGLHPGGVRDVYCVRLQVHHNASSLLP